MNLVKTQCGFNQIHDFFIAVLFLIRDLRYPFSPLPIASSLNPSHLTLYHPNLCHSLVSSGNDNQDLHRQTAG